MFFSRQVLMNFAPPGKEVPSGTLTSVINPAESQGGGAWVAVGVTVGAGVLVAGTFEVGEGCWGCEVEVGGPGVRVEILAASVSIAWRVCAAIVLERPSGGCVGAVGRLQAANRIEKIKRMKGDNRFIALSFLDNAENKTWYSTLFLTDGIIPN